MLANDLSGQIVATMQSWVGRNEHDGSYLEILRIYNSFRPLPRCYPLKPSDEWCAGTVSSAGIINGCADIIHPECGVEEMARLYMPEKRFVTNKTYVPHPGHIVMYDWHCCGWGDHVGIVEKVDGSDVIAIEGNRHSAVARRRFPVGWKYIRGYALPDYEAKAARFSVEALAQKGVINSPDYWSSVVSEDSVPGLRLLVGLASNAIVMAGPRTETVEEGLQRLMQAGVTGEPEYWMQAAAQVPNVGELIKALGGCV